LSAHVEERRKMISEAFHTLNQPLTGLHCGLEIALQKPRSDEEYRQRIGDGIDNAGAILQFVRAIRQLVEAGDPGERFGTVDLAAVLSQLEGELEVVAEALQVRVAVHHNGGCKVMADPLKLMAALGTLADERVRRSGAGAHVELRMEVIGSVAKITLTSDSVAPAGLAKSLEPKLAEIRRNAAYCYLWRVGGEVRTGDDTLSITLPLVY
jgi:two-component system, OmpR family, heavy metal sensor histidine kinase CusS